MAFLDENYLITNETGKRIFRKIAKLPVYDAHNHANMQEIAADQPYRDLWQLLAATDHYVWEIMRKCGVKEEFITGDRTPKEKFLELARIMPLAVGNPVYEWLHLDLRRCFGIDDLLCEKNGEKIWNAGLAELAKPENLPQAMLTGKLNIGVMCSTDDPVDLLKEHDEVNSAVGRTLVRPTWRPDKAMNIHAPGWNAYIDRLGERFGHTVRTYEDLLELLRMSHDYFAEHGCRASDHGVTLPPPEIASSALTVQLFRRARDGETLSEQEISAFQGSFLLDVAAMDADADWVFQCHAGAVRDVRTSIFEKLGPDAGGDVCNAAQDFLPGLLRLLNLYDGRLKTVLYTLDPVQTPTLATVARAFGETVRLGSAWWLWDTPIGMRRQLEYIGSVDLLHTFAGMVSDSRKLTSYGSRFEMFRRTLADVLGDMAERGQAPEELLTDIAVRICGEGPKQFFNL